MTRTAIVTLSCPHCGGRTEGVRSVEAPQTLACPYCRTELHVPRVGGLVVENVTERVIERVVERPLEPETNPVAVLVAVVLAFVIVLVMAAVRCNSHTDLETWRNQTQQESQQREDCRQTCKASCPASEHTLAELARQDVRHDSVAFDRALAHDRCVIDCDTACWTKP